MFLKPFSKIPAALCRRNLRFI